MYTFGGQWYEGDRDNVDNWINNPNLNGLGIISTDPKRVPKVRK